MTEARPLILYHGPDCADGFCAAWVARRKFGEEADYLPVQYGQEPPDVTGRDVTILDFSFKADVMLRMAHDAYQILVLDHHKTAEEEFERLTDIFQHDIPPTRLVYKFDMTKSGGRLTWEKFFPKEDAPWLVGYTEDRDLWRWKLPHSREISAAIASYPQDFDLWDRWAMTANGWNATPSILASEGEAILRYQQQQVLRAVANAVEIELAGHKVLAVNATTLISETAGLLAEGRPFGATYFIKGDGKKVWSLRSASDGVDVSEVAKKFGGGGHKSAAGFTE